MSPIQEAHSSVTTDADMTEAATSNYIEAVLRGSQEIGDTNNSSNHFSNSNGGGISENLSSNDARSFGHTHNGIIQDHSGNLLTAGNGTGFSQQTLAQTSAATTESTSSPPLPAASSVYGLGGPPPTYEQHMNALEQRQLPMGQTLQYQQHQQVMEVNDSNLSTNNSVTMEGSEIAPTPWSFGSPARNNTGSHLPSTNTTDQSQSQILPFHPSTNSPGQPSNPSLTGHLPPSLSNVAVDGSVPVSNQHLMNILNQSCLQQTAQAEFISSSSMVPATTSVQMQQLSSPSSPSSLLPSPMNNNSNSQLQSSVPSTPKSLNTSSSTLESSPPVPNTISDPGTTSSSTLLGGVSNRPAQNVLEPAPNPPLSPISESSSGVGNNLSGGNTRSVSAAVSDESVAGDSGVFEASVKR